MDVKKLVTQLLKLSLAIDDIEKTVVYVFVHKMGCDYTRSQFFADYFKNVDTAIANIVSDHINKSSVPPNIETLVEVFEMLIPVDERKANGMVYTPDNIKNYILEKLITSEHIPTICDPACGCGSFLLSAAEYIHVKYAICYSEIFEKYIYGVDIVKRNIGKCAVLFNLLALTAHETIGEGFNLVCGNALNLKWEKSFRRMPKDGFDYIIGNPPYVRSRNISGDIRKDILKWNTAGSGNVDLYILFYEIGLWLLNDAGKLGYISPNTFIQSVNGRALRKYLKEKEYSISILDFRETQMFKNVTSYTCISLIDKTVKGGIIKYALLNGKSSLYDYSFTEYVLSSFNGVAPWRLGNKEIDKKIKKIENTGVKLGAYKIRNGLATLKNDVYFYTPTSEDALYYYRNFRSKLYKIEKSICISVAKPNIVKSENELAEKMQKAIFPYIITGNRYKLIDEDAMRQMYPCAYRFLLAAKSELSKRDKGNGKYPAWYAYGRTQGLLNFGKKLLLPYIADSPAAVLSTDEKVLFYCGYAIFSDDTKELLALKKILQSSVFWYYILNTSKPYAKGYMSFAKNYIKDFGVPVLTEEQKSLILSIADEMELNEYVQGLYGVSV
jgi:methylase of polypeptide subunit release factors